MNKNKSSGKSSCKGRENGDASTSSERPLKKARFAWQVKGKYHLKNDTDDSNKKSAKLPTQPSTCKPSSSSSQSSSTTFGSEEQDYLVKESCCKLDSVVNRDHSLLTLNTRISKDNHQYPRYLTSYESTSNSMSENKSHNYMSNVSMVENVEDLCIAQWQARQVINGCLDNTLNRVLESWYTLPFPAEEANTNRSLTLDFAEYFNYMPGDNNVENEGILMAISAHGLQNTSSNSSNNASNEGHCSTSSPQAYDIPSTLESLSAVVSDEDSQHTKNQQCDTEETLPDINWQSDNQNANDTTPFSCFSEPSPSPYDYYSDRHQNSNMDSLEIDSHFDLMNAAVLYAINSKGLTASVTEYG